jgi:hypothetical protein
VSTAAATSPSAPRSACFDGAVCRSDGAGYCPDRAACFSDGAGYQPPAGGAGGGAESGRGKLVVNA